MIDWRTIHNYQPSDFQYPDKLQVSIVGALDLFTDVVGVKAQVLDDWRPFDSNKPNSRHAFGDALDVFFPNRSPVVVLKQAERSGVFDGIGIYLNDRGAVSFHFDTRGSRARWGAFVNPVVDPDTGKVSRINSYTTLEAVLERVRQLASGVVTAATDIAKKNPLLVLALLVALALLLKSKH